MKEKIYQGIKIVIFLSLSAILLYLAFRKVNLGNIFRQLLEAQYSWLLLSFSFSMLAFISRARRWILMIRPMGYRPGLWNTYHALLTGYLVNFGLPRLGEFTRCVSLGRKEKIPVDKLFGTVIAERAFDFVSLIVILIIMLIIRNEIMTSFLRDYVIIPLKVKFDGIFSFSSLFLIITALILIISGALAYRFREEIRKLKFYKKTASFFSGILNGIKAFVSIENKPEFIFHTLFIWINYILMTWVVVFMIPATSHLTFGDGVFLVVIGSLAMAAPVQGGIGAFHWIVSRGLNAVYGVPMEDGLVYATISHESQLILIAVLGTISFIKIFGKRRGITVTDQTSDSDGKE